jgi:hypothetical protein
MKIWWVLVLCFWENENEEESSRSTNQIKAIQSKHGGPNNLIVKVVVVV